MATYRNKPVTREAFQFGYDSPPDWFMDAVTKRIVDTHGKSWAEGGGYSSCIIRTLEGDHLANKGDYIIQGVKGELYPCKPDIFKMTYEKIN